MNNGRLHKAATGLHLDKEKLSYIDKHCYCALIRRGARAVTQLFDYYLSKIDLKATQFSLLIAIANANSQNLTCLAKQMVMDRTTLTRNIMPLKKQGLVTITTSFDKRAKLYQLTEEGKKLIGVAMESWGIANSELQKTVTACELEKLVDGIDKVLKIVEQWRKNLVKNS